MKISSKKIKTETKYKTGQYFEYFCPEIEKVVYFKKACNIKQIYSNTSFVDKYNI